MKQKKQSAGIILSTILFLSFSIAFHTRALANSSWDTTKLPSKIDTAKMSYNQISTNLKLYVFPSKDQSKDQQKKDEYACYQWAIEQSGIDPQNLPQIKADTVKTGPDGQVVGSAAKGALVGLAIGSVSGNAGQGAAVGAIAGGAGGVGRKKRANARKEQQAQAEVAKKQEDIKSSFLKAFSACAEGKGYTVK